MKHFTLITIFSLSLLSLVSFGQAVEGDYDYSREIIWGVNKNTNSGLIGGLMAKYGIRKSERSFHSIGLEIVNVKHPKEVRYPSFSGSTFIWGKQHYLYSIRTQYGHERVLFKKAPQQGVQINGIIMGGPTFGVVAPYYIEYNEGAPSTSYNSKVVPFDPNVHTERLKVMGTGALFQGINESKLKMGLNLKTSLSFEFGTFKNNVTGFEAGLMMEAFPEKIIIVPSASNKSVYTSAFITLFYGSRR